MTDYSKMSDFEINKAVAEHLYKDSPSLIVKRDVPSRPAVTVFCDIGNEEIVSIVCADYCNNPAEAWPIIVKNEISVLFGFGEQYITLRDAKKYYWAGAGVGCDQYGYFDNNDELQHSSYNPLRSAMIVFLMMKEAENV